jgi:hypothetical protein
MYNVQCHAGLTRLGYVHLLTQGDVPGAQQQPAPLLGAGFPQPSELTSAITPGTSSSLHPVSVGPDPATRVPGLVLPASVMMPAACQGAVGVMVRRDDKELIR